MGWIICQLGAREHYAIPRALLLRGELDLLLADFWVKPGSVIGRIPRAQRLRDRYHSDLNESPVHSANLNMMGFELSARLRKVSGWDLIIARNQMFQSQAIQMLERWESRTARRGVPALFSYSYAARDLFQFAKNRGWKTVLGQIDPGPEEERIVAAEHENYSDIKTKWQPAPAAYWEIWKEELELADRIIVNSEWSRECLRKEGVPEEKVKIVPLVYESPIAAGNNKDSGKAPHYNDSRPFRILFLGQINLRKGVGRLLDAMRMLRDEEVELILAGPSELADDAWTDLPKVKWVGTVPRSEVSEWYQNADVFILPTLSDGYALTQLEALAHGLPVIASKFCGEAVEEGKNGWILPDLEPDTIAGMILVAKKERHELGLIQSSSFGINDLGEVLMNL